MDAWGKSVAAGDKVLMLADGNGQFAKALGVELDLTDKGLGVRSRRYALLADDQVGGGGGPAGGCGCRLCERLGLGERGGGGGKGVLEGVTGAPQPQPPTHICRPPPPPSGGTVACMVVERPWLQNLLGRLTFSCIG